MMKDKRGAEMTIGTIIVIILAIVVLVILIYGFTSGWGNLWERLTSFGGGKVNVQSVVDGCKVACSTSSDYDYCLKERDVIFEANQKSQKKRCIDLQGQYGLEACASIDCGAVNTDYVGKACVDPVLTGNWVKGAVCNPNNQVDVTNNQILLTSDKNEHVNEKCCIDKKAICPNNDWIVKVNKCPSGYYDITFLLTTTAVIGHENDKCCVQ